MLISKLLLVERPGSKQLNNATKTQEFWNQVLQQTARKNNWNDFPQEEHLRERTSGSGSVTLSSGRVRDVTPWGVRGFYQRT